MRSPPWIIKLIVSLSPPTAKWSTQTQRLALHTRFGFPVHSIHPAADRLLEVVRAVPGGRRGARGEGRRYDDDRRAVPVYDHQNGLVLDAVPAHADTGAEGAGEATAGVRSKQEEVEDGSSGRRRGGGRVRWPQIVEGLQGLESSEEIEEQVAKQRGQIPKG